MNTVRKQVSEKGPIFLKHHRLKFVFENTFRFVKRYRLSKACFKSSVSLHGGYVSRMHHRNRLKFSTRSLNVMNILSSENSHMTFLKHHMLLRRTVMV